MLLKLNSLNLILSIAHIRIVLDKRPATTQTEIIKGLA